MTQLEKSAELLKKGTMATHSAPDALVLTFQEIDASMLDLALYALPRTAL